MSNITNLRSHNNFINSHWDWTPFNPCFVTASGQQTRIRISDIDGSVERNGHFLIMETKRPGEEMKEGQKRYLRASVRRMDAVLVLHGHPNMPDKLFFYRPNTDQPQIINPCVLSDALRVVKGWFLWADANGYIEPFAN